MGQILVGSATAQFDCLRNAFYVGDVLLKRDCRALRTLAINCTIINMYGKLESQFCYQPLSYSHSCLSVNSCMSQQAMVIVNFFGSNRLYKRNTKCDCCRDD